MNWGTQNAVPLEDPKYGILLHIRAYGTYGIRIKDSRLFVNELVGAVQNGSTITYNFTANYFSGLLATKVKNILSKYMIKEKISFLEVSAYLDEISKECQTELTDEFDRFGSEILNFYVESITPPEDEFEKLRNYKEELSMGEDFYRQRRSFDILESMANNDSVSGLANAGVGLGMGLGVAQTAGNLFSNISSNIDINNGNANSPSIDNGQTIICPNCGFKNPSGQKFCGSCGQSLQPGIMCPKCGKINPVGQSFCGECGTKLVKICPKCGNENDLSQKFCGECGTVL